MSICLGLIITRESETASLVELLRGILVRFKDSRPIFEKWAKGFNNTYFKYIRLLGLYLISKM